MCHCQQEDWQRERASNPEPSAHVAQLAKVFDALDRNRFWFQRHATLWASARMVLLDLRVHRTGVDGFLFGTSQGLSDVTAADSSFNFQVKLRPLKRCAFTY